MLRTFIFYCLFYPWTLLIILVALPLSLLGPDWLHRCGIIWGRGCLLWGGLKLTVQGTQNIPANQAAIYVANHQSNFDIPILYAGLPIQFRWLAKKELFKVPLFGLAMKRGGYIPIDRSNRQQTMHSLNQAAERIRAGASIIIFPEGTRTSDGHLQEFKKGALLIAAKAQVPVVPVVIKGSYRLQPKGSWRISPGPLELVVLPPISTPDLQVRDVANLTRQVHDQIGEQLLEESAHGR